MLAQRSRTSSGWWRPSVAIAAALALATVAFVSTGPPALAQEEGVRTGGAMAIDCNDVTPDQVDRECDYPEGGQFNISVHVTDSPDPNYGAWQTKVRWDPAVVDYVPSPSADGEKDWPDCTIPARSDNRTNVEATEPDPSVLFGCVPLPAKTSNFTGKVVHFAMRCVGGGASPINLVAREGDPQLGSHFIAADQNLVDPSLTGAEVTCGGAAADGEQPDPAAQTATAAAAAGQTPGAATTGTVTGTVSPQAGVTGTPSPTSGDEDDDDDDDGGGLPVWAWIIIGVGGVGALGGLGYLGWLRARGGAGPGGPTPAG